MSLSFITKRLFTTKVRKKPKICIVGSGPAGFYAAQHLIKKLQDSEVDLYERLPVPFGLVRFGVAPDHPEVKNVINTFTKTASFPNFKFFGNVNLGTDVTLEELREAYHVVLLAYGAEESRSLNIKGEGLQNCLQARKFVGWYNGVPQDKDLDVDLSGESVAIFGQGNVAIDVARILLTPVDFLRNTDITQYALQALSRSKIKTVYLIGRRGPLQAAFTIRELREMLKLPCCQTTWQEQDFLNIPEIIPNLQRPRKRITELMLKSLKDPPKEACTKQFKVLFHRSPLEISGTNTVEQVLLGINKLEGKDLLTQTAALTDLKETIQCQLVVTSIGYKSVQADKGIPFDHVRGIVKNDRFKADNGLYVTGWLGTGPVGVILTTMNNAFECGEVILKDMCGELEEKGGRNVIEGTLIKKGVQIVDWKGWERIDEYERRQGELAGKPREKVVDIKKMLEIAAG